MTPIPAKPINELEKKTWVSNQDSILILDASTGEARLADKEELRWPRGFQGIKWDTGAKGETGEAWPKGDRGERGLKWEQGVPWPIWPTWPQWPTGAGSWDMLKANNLSDVVDKAQARENLWVYDKDYINSLDMLMKWENRTPRSYATVLDRGILDMMGANRLSYLPPEQVKIEISDDWNTWRDLSVTDRQKRQLFDNNNSSPHILRFNSNQQLRITMDPFSPSGSLERYFVYDMIYVYLSTNWNEVWVKQEYSTLWAPDRYVTDIDFDPNKYVNVRPGNMVLGCQERTFGWYSSQDHNQRKLRLTFKAYKKHSTNWISIGWIRAFGHSIYTVPNPVAYKNTPYTTDEYGNAEFFKALRSNDPETERDVANKQYVDSKLNTKADLVGGLVPSSQLPSYVDDILEYANRSAFPETGEKGKIYIAINDDSQWRWTGTDYKKMVSSPWSTDAIPEGSQNLYFTDTRAKSAVQSELNGKSNVGHSHTKAEVGLWKVDNTSDADKNSAKAMLTNKTINGDQNTITKVNSLKNVNGNSELQLRVGTQIEYEAISPKNPTTLYIVKEV